MATEAYAVFDSSDGSLTIFRDALGKYTNGQTSGTKTYYAGIEDIEGNTNPKWYSKRTSITAVNITDKFVPKTAYVMFGGCSNLVSINGLKNMDTGNIVSMAGMFTSCVSLTTLDLSSFNTSNVSNISYMFGSCLSLTTIDLSNFDTSNVSNMNGMFSRCESLTTLDLSSFDISNVTDMLIMFAMCKSLITLDLSSFDTSNVTNMGQMFQDCETLTTIYVDGNKWNTSAVTDSRFMFKGCPNLVGEKGTIYDSNYIDKTRAIVDNAPDNPGYLTRKVSKKYSLYVKQNNTWYQGTIKTKKNNTWQNIIKIYTKVNGSWIQT